MRSRFPKTERECIQGRLAEAQRHGGARAAEPIGPRTFAVVGSRGDRYRVAVLALDRIICNCAAGQNNRLCWHAASAYLRTVADQGVHS